MAAKSFAELLKDARAEIAVLDKDAEHHMQRNDELRRERTFHKELSDERGDTIKELRGKLERAEGELQSARIAFAELDGYRRRVRDCDRQELLDNMVKGGAVLDDLWPLREGSNTVGGYAEGVRPRSFA